MVKLLATETKVLEPGIYNARLVAIEERTGSFVGKSGDTETGTYLNWKFRLVDEGHEGEFVYGNSSASFGTKSKARKWASGILGRPIQTGEEITDAMLLDRDCALTLSIEERDGGRFNRIDAVSPVRSASGKSAQAQFAEAGEAAGLLRRYSIARGALDWSEQAVRAHVAQVSGSQTPFERLPLLTQRTVVHSLEQAAKHPDQYTEEGDIEF